jgi:hypothetical protein
MPHGSRNVLEGVDWLGENLLPHASDEHERWVGTSLCGSAEGTEGR